MGQSGIQIDAGGAVHIRDSTLYWLGGCAVVARDVTLVTIENVTSNDIFCGATLQKTSAGPLTFAIDNLRSTDSTRYGIMLGSSSSTGPVKVVISNSAIANARSDACLKAQNGATLVSFGGNVLAGT